MIQIVCWLKRAKMVLDERDLFPETAVALGVIREGVLSRMFFRLQQGLRRRACSVIAATPGIRKRLIGYGFPEEKVRLLYNADAFLHEDESQHAGGDSLRDETGKTFLVGYTGGLGKANDIPTLLRAAQRLQDVEALAIVIIGSGERRREYEEHCKQQGLGNVFFRDAVPRRQARQLIGQMDVCVQPLPDRVSPGSRRGAQLNPSQSRPIARARNESSGSVRRQPRATLQESLAGRAS